MSVTICWVWWVSPSSIKLVIWDPPAHWPYEFNCRHTELAQRSPDLKDLMEMSGALFLYGSFLSSLTNLKLSSAQAQEMSSTLVETSEDPRTYLVRHQSTLLVVWCMKQFLHTFLSSFLVIWGIYSVVVDNKILIITFWGQQDGSSSKCTCHANLMTWVWSLKPM